MKILVRSTNWLGDAVMTLPALERLRKSHPSATISVLTKPGLAPLFELSGLVDEVVLHEKRSGVFARARSFLNLLSLVRKHRFDTAILFQSAFEAAFLTFLARIPRRVGYETQGRSLLLTDVVRKDKSDSPRHETNDYIALVDRAGSEAGHAAGGCQPPMLAASEKERQLALTLLGSYGGAGGSDSIVVLNAGATNSEAKRWPESHFAELSDLCSEKLDSQVVLVGSASEESIARHIESMAKGKKPLNLAGLTDIPTLIGLLSLARLVISNDTGTAHVAAALGTPVLTIFGPTNEFETAPLGARSEILRAPGIECQRCMLRECPIDHRCMTRIAAEEVFGRAVRMLELQCQT